MWIYELGKRLLVSRLCQSAEVGVPWPRIEGIEGRTPCQELSQWALTPHHAPKERTYSFLCLQPWPRVEGVEGGTPCQELSQWALTPHHAPKERNYSFLRLQPEQAGEAAGGHAAA
mmetsp:Transcript_34310/g.55392  ORF Transcript_34310/g.55392 Transcript_34310/m.55392 type:complete len:116 (+) Transcript_34310:1014-1361(+)